jgi:hypothetical protein
MAKSNNVVLLSTGLDVERHQGFDKWFNELESSGPNVFSIRPHLTLRNNLRVQTAAIAGSKAFVGTYGGFAYITPFAGVPAVTFYSREEGFVYEHMDVGCGYPDLDLRLPRPTSSNEKGWHGNGLRTD